MASLSAHLRQAGDHGRLGFHADCPVCREERLFGTLSSEGVLSRRAQAALATGALAFSLAATSPVWAQESDSRQEGTVAPQEPSQGTEGDAPLGVDPGGDTVLPFDGAPQGGADDAEGENAPLETEPEVDPDVRLVPPTDPDATPPPAGETSPPGTGTPEDPVAVETDPRQGATEKRPGRTGVPRKSGEPERQPAQWPERSTPPAVAPRTTAPLQTAGAVAQASPTVAIAAAGRGDVAPPSLRPGSRYHVVRPGDSLWSIARSLLSPHASMARIAREVAHLWELNEDRIATGDPDLLKIGTRLRLR